MEDAARNVLEHVARNVLRGRRQRLVGDRQRLEDADHVEAVAVDLLAHII